MDAEMGCFVPIDITLGSKVLSWLRCFTTSGWIFGWALVASAIPAVQAMGQESNSKRLLKQPTDIESLQTRTKIEMELDGALSVEDKSAKQSGGMRSVPVKAKATQDYFEMVAYQDGKQTAAARQFLSARLENWVTGKSVDHMLRDDCRDTRVLEVENSWEQYCPTRPLNRREVELLRAPINSMMLERLLPNQPAKANSDWAVSEDDAKHLFNLDAVHRSDLRARITSVDKGLVKIELYGKLDATADSVSTEIQVRGAAHVQVGSQGPMVKWLGVSIQEIREVSRLRPGFNITARIQLIREEQPKMQLADRQELLKLAATEDPSRWLVQLESSMGKYAMYAARNWVTYVDGTEDSVLKMIENNQSIAQCNIGQLPKMESGSQLTAEGLEADIRAALKERFEEVLETTEKVTASGLRLLRMEVSGTQEQIPIRWIYAHLSDDSGRRVALVFTLAAEYAEQFAGCDLQMLDSFHFTNLESESAPKILEAPQESAQSVTPKRR